MASVRVCRVCGHWNALTEEFCPGVLPNGETCGVAVKHLPKEEEEVLRQRAAAEAAARESPSVPRGATVLEPRPRQAEIELPWGAERVGERLAIGRDPAFSPLAARIQALQKVSGEHAELTFDGAVLAVRHLGRTNPTRVNGRPLQTGEMVELADGDELGFSTELAGRVRIL